MLYPDDTITVAIPELVPLSGTGWPFPPGSSSMNMSFRPVRGRSSAVASVFTWILFHHLGSIWVVTTTPWKLRDSLLDIPTAESLGGLMLTRYVLPFEIASILLTVALIGAIVIARED